MNSVYVKTLGCKVNTYDSHALENQFQRNGYNLSDLSTSPDVFVLNTCSVTQNAGKEARYLARRIKREHPNTYLVVTGCYAQTDSKDLLDIDEIDFVVPNEAKQHLIQYVTRGMTSNRAKMPEHLKPVKGNRQSHFKTSLTLFDRAKSSQTRTFLKVQDGCDGFCSYCLIPYARGSSRSVAFDQVMEEVLRLDHEGIPELVFTGIHLGDYGDDLEGGVSLGTLVDSVCKQTRIPRIRLSSLEPSEVKPDLLAALEQHQARICDHFHLPLQSGHDRILKLMNRKYSCAEYRDAVANLRTIFPLASIGADVIPGFPGETPDEFEATLQFCRDLELSYLHVFPYSKRPNTAAARMPGHLDQSVVKDRAAKLRELSKFLQRQYEQQFLNCELPVLWEEKLDEHGRRFGKTMNYLEVIGASGADVEAHQTSLVRIKGWSGNHLLGARVTAERESQH